MLYCAGGSWQTPGGPEAQRMPPGCMRSPGRREEPLGTLEAPGYCIPWGPLGGLPPASPVWCSTSPRPHRYCIQPSRCIVLCCTFISPRPHLFPTSSPPLSHTHLISIPPASPLCPPLRLGTVLYAPAPPTVLYLTPATVLYPSLLASLPHRHSTAIPPLFHPRSTPYLLYCIVLCLLRTLALGPPVGPWETHGGSWGPWALLVVAPGRSPGRHSDPGGHWGPGAPGGSLGA